MAIKVTVWNEYVHEVGDSAAAKYIRQFYPNGIHNAIKENIAADDLEIRAVTLQDPEQGLPEDVLNDTDVLVWWGHCAHHQVEDALVDRIQQRILQGMGLIVLHSGHYSKIFKRMMGTSCSLRWREIGEKERVWVVDKQHPITQGIPDSFVVPNTEMYGEPFGIPNDAHDVFISWYEGGNVFRSGVTFQRGAGKIFYFSPGHETFPIYNNPDVAKVIQNACRWAAATLPPQKTTCWDCDPPTETVTTVNPLKQLDTKDLHEKAE